MIRFRFTIIFVYILCVSIVTADEVPFRVFFSTQKPFSFFPFHQSDGFSSSYINQIFEPLFTTDQNGALQPLLAERWSWVDRQTLEVKLRKNVYFHNGEPFNSRSVKYTFDFFASKVDRPKNW